MDRLNTPAASRHSAITLAGWLVAALSTSALCGVLVFGGVPWQNAAPAVVSGSEVITGVGVGGSPAPPLPRLSLVGTVEPGRLVNVVAPFAGMVEEKRFDFGDRVERGRPLFVMDVRDLTAKRRDAEAALLKATQRVEELKGWNNGAEMARARRQLFQAEREALQAEHRVRDAKPLIEHGIIPRQEFEDLKRQADSLAAGRDAAREDLAAVIRQGGPQNLRLAELELANAGARLAELDEQLAHATVTAPVSGLILKPHGLAAGAAGPPAVEAGTMVTGNQIALVIADLERLVVSARLDELDLDRVPVGQAVEVSFDAVAVGPLRGRVGWVAHQATAAESGAPAASFPIRVELPDLSDDQRRRIRIGLTANLAIVTENHTLRSSEN